MSADSPEGPEDQKRGFRIYEREAWEREVASETWDFRHARADAHQDKAQRAKRDGDRTRQRWHSDREAGQRERFVRVAECGTSEIHLRCEHCGHEMTQRVLSCDQWRLCRLCRARRATRYQGRFRPARKKALEAHARLFRPDAPGGRWGERFLTLTLPHSGDIRQDIKTLPALWGSFRNQVKKHLTADRGVPKKVAAFPYVRVVEVTPGADQLGHAHVHVWMLSPFLHHELLRLWWGRALLSHGYKPPFRPLAEVLDGCQSEGKRQQLARLLVTQRGRRGRPLDPVPWPVVDVRKCHGDVEREFIKYLIKDAERSPDGALMFMDPALFAAIYEALEGIRTVQASVGFWPKEALEHDVLACEKCGGSHLKTTRMSRRAGDPVTAKPKRNIRKAGPAKEGDPERLSGILARMLPDVNPDEQR